ncbi:hypothetical protein GNI_070900 [Gregarina niphandrodes]|uniref:Uncharacterized protein n=1 Tax=Gregarina niphandrodes TaxID=110365 RepID=A0A023B7B3_GRENI|nr:hypothetical protein GNI_070900 [Gregarina niphandrodes]EZG67184.1 hypothetical protein GNI_070900 [Gregarina niphandrodes]|eukprot:XP_011130313.1 hypothetical protein GNI_070900 [Gregarina niphandrodes]
MDMTELGSCLDEIPLGARCSCVSFGDSQAKSSVCRASDEQGCAIWFDFEQPAGNWLPVQIELVVGNFAWDSEAGLSTETFATEEPEDCNCLTLGQNDGTVPSCYNVNVTDNMQRVMRSNDREQIDIVNLNQSRSLNSTVLVRFNSTDLCQDIHNFRVSNRYLTMNALEPSLNSMTDLHGLLIIIILFLATGGI